MKPNLGHGEAASGITSVIEALMMLGKGLIAKHIGIKTGINESHAIHFLENIRVHLNTVPFTTANEDCKRRPLRSGTGPRLAGWLYREGSSDPERPNIKQASCFNLS